MSDLICPGCGWRGKDGATWPTTRGGGYGRCPECYLPCRDLREVSLKEMEHYERQAVARKPKAAVIGEADIQRARKAVEDYIKFSPDDPAVAELSRKPFILVMDELSGMVVEESQPAFMRPLMLDLTKNMLVRQMVERYSMSIADRNMLLFGDLLTPAEMMVVPDLKLKDLAVPYTDMNLFESMWPEPKPPKLSPAEMLKWDRNRKRTSVFSQYAAPKLKTSSSYTISMVMRQEHTGYTLSTYLTKSVHFIKLKGSVLDVTTYLHPEVDKLLTYMKWRC